MKNVILTLYKPYEEIYLEPTEILDSQSAAYSITTMPQHEGYTERIEIQFEDNNAKSTLGICLRQWILNNIYRIPYLKFAQEVDSLSRLIVQAISLLRDEGLLWANDPISVKEVLETLIVALRIWAGHNSDQRGTLVYEFKLIMKESDLIGATAGNQSDKVSIYTDI